MKKEKPKIIIKTLRNKDDKIIRLSLKDKVTKIGNSCHIVLPISLLNRYVKIDLEVLE